MIVVLLATMSVRFFKCTTFQWNFMACMLRSTKIHVLTALHNEVMVEHMVPAACMLSEFLLVCST